mgnify:CR=1 FL=1
MPNQKRTAAALAETTPADWTGEHFANSCPGLFVLVLWSIVQDDAGYGYCVHRASVRVGANGRAEITFDSPSLKAKKRAWEELAGETMWLLPSEHKRAIAHWYKGEW